MKVSAALSGWTISIATVKNLMAFASSRLRQDFASFAWYVVTDEALVRWVLSRAVSRLKRTYD
jgi:hypothetical protein